MTNESLTLQSYTSMSHRANDGILHHTPVPK